MKRTLYLGIFVFILCIFLMPNVQAEKKLIDTCYYNFNRISPNNDLEKDAYMKVDIYQESTGYSAVVNGLNEFSQLTSDGEINNWGEESDAIFDSEIYYLENGCPPYAIIYYEYSVTYYTREIALVDYELINDPGQYTDGFDAEIYFMGLIDPDAEIEEGKTCKYGKFDIKYTKDNNVLEIIGKEDGIYLPALEMYLAHDSVDLCQNVYVCQHAYTAQTFLYNDNIVMYNDYESLNYLDWRGDSCNLYEPKENKSPNATCVKYANLFKGNDAEGLLGMEDYWTKYKECKENNNAACIATEKSNYDDSKLKLRNWCNTVLSNKNYDDSCVEKCLQMSEDIYDLEDITKTKGTCGFSQRLIIYFANIIRWIKYIIPVVVIILGILDFIKATAGDKDDEMKKAQGRFIKRLISAALIFVIPVIIQFILEKMGFAANGCGVIDL